MVYFNGTKHPVTYAGGNKVSIGCYSATLEEWENEWKDIALEEGYTEAEVKEYAMYIELIKQFVNQKKQAMNMSRMKINLLTIKSENGRSYHCHIIDAKSVRSYMSSGIDGTVYVVSGSDVFDTEKKAKNREEFVYAVHSLECDFLIK